MWYISFPLSLHSTTLHILSPSLTPLPTTPPHSTPTFPLSLYSTPLHSHPHLSLYSTTLQSHPHLSLYSTTLHHTPNPLPHDINSTKLTSKSEIQSLNRYNFSPHDFYAVSRVAKKLKCRCQRQAESITV